MQYLLYLLLPVLSVTKGMCQTYGTRSNVRTFKDNVFLNTFMLFVAAAIFGAIYIRGLPNLPVFLFSLGFGVASVVFQFFYSLAYKYGSVAITSTIVSFSIAIQIAIGLFVFQETLSPLNVIGFLPMIASIILMTKKDNKNNEKEKNFTKWIIYLIISFIANSATVILQMFFKHQPKEVASLTGEFVAWSYVIAFVLAAIVLIIFCLIDRRPIYKQNFKSVWPIVVAGIALVTYNFLSTVALDYFPSAIFYPIRSGITTVILFTADITINKFKITKKQIIGAACAILAVVFLSL